MEEDSEGDIIRAISILLNERDFKFIINNYNKGIINGAKLHNIYIMMGFVGNSRREDFMKAIEDGTNYIFKVPKPIDYKKIRAEKLQLDIDLLFDRETLFKETILVFEKEGKNSLTYDELFEIRKINHEYVELEDKYPEITIRLLRDFTNKFKPVKKENVIKWFNKEPLVTAYRIRLLYDYFSNNKELIVSKQQEKWLNKWCSQTSRNVSFNKAITKDNSGGTSFDRNAMYVAFFNKRFNIELSKDTLLDMISFDFPTSLGEWCGINHIFDKLNKNDIVNRMLMNMKKGIEESTVLINHVKYLIKNNVIDSYKYIVDEIYNNKREYYHRHEILKWYVDATGDITSIKNKIDEADSEIIWSVLDILLENKDDDFVEEFLLKYIKEDLTPEDYEIAAAHLVSLQNMQGLSIYTELITNSTILNVGPFSAQCLSRLKNAESIPYLIKLLDFSLNKAVKVDDFSNYYSTVISALMNVGTTSEENLGAVKKAIINFRDNQIDKDNNAKYLTLTIEQMEHQFYIKQAQSYTIKDVKAKLQMLQL